MDAQSIIPEIAPPLDQQLVESLLEEFVDIERRFLLGDWEPAMLDGGQFAEVASRIVYHIDSGNLSRKKSVHDCLRYVEDEGDSNTHAFVSRQAALHLCRALRMLYRLRSKRGAIHIDPEYDANELDATFVMAIARWIMAELLRVFWKGDTAVVARAVREIVRYEVPAVLVMDGRPLVLRTDCTVEEEVLIALHNAGEAGLTRQEIGRAVPRSPGAVSNSLTALASAGKRQVVKRDGGSYVLTPNGTRRVFEDLSQKLSL